MVDIPIPQTIETRRVPGFFTAPGVANPQNPGAAQIERAGQALTRSSLQIANAATQLKDRLDYTGAKRGQALANEHVVDAVRGFTNLVGAKASQDARDAMWTQLTEKVTEIGGGLENDVQTSIYTDAMQARLLAARQALDGHLDTQSKVAAVGATAAALEGKLDGVYDAGVAAARRVDQEGGEAYQEAWRYAVVAAEDEAAVYGDLQGWGASQREAYVQEQLTAAHAQVIDKLVDEGGVDNARGYLELVGDSIPAFAKGSLESLLDDASVQGDAEEAVAIFRDDIDLAHQDHLAKNPEAARSAASDTEASAADLLIDGLAEVQAWRDVNPTRSRVADQMEQEVRRQAADRRDRELNQRASVRKQAEDALIADTTLSVEGLSPTLQRDIVRNDLLVDMRNFSGSQGRYGTNKEMLLDIYDGLHMDIESRREFINTVRGKLNPAEENEAVALWEHSQRLTPTTDAGGWAIHVKELASKLNILRPTPAQVRAGGVGARAAETVFYNFRNAVTEKLHAFERRKGSKATLEDMQTVTNRVFQNDVLINDGWWSWGDTPTKSIFLTPDQFKDAYVTRDQVTAAFRAADPTGVVPNEIVQADAEIFSKKIPEVERSIVLDIIHEDRRAPSEANIAAEWLMWKAKQANEVR